MFDNWRKFFRQMILLHAAVTHKTLATNIHRELLMCLRLFSPIKFLIENAAEHLLADISS